MDAAFRTPVLLMGWLSVVLVLDRADGGGSLWFQRGLGLLTWALLLLALRWFSPTVRCQAIVVVAFATCIEYLCSPTLEVYLYRFENVPAYVPPGHGLVYLSAYALGHVPWVRRHLTEIAYAVALVGGAWAFYALVFAERPDVLGAMWFGCLVAFLAWGPSREVYVGAFVVVSHLELLGTALGNWAWQAHDPILGIAIGNPPSGAAGGYGWFDLAGLLVAPYLLAWWARASPTPMAPPPEQAQPEPAWSLEP
jgi:hypothetical protein